jgi:hypothetical protein
MVTSNVVVKNNIINIILDLFHRNDWHRLTALYLVFPSKIQSNIVVNSRNKLNIHNVLKLLVIHSQMSPPSIYNM